MTRSRFNNFMTTRPYEICKGWTAVNPHIIGDEYRSVPFYFTRKLARQYKKNMGNSKLKICKVNLEIFI